MMSQSNLLTYHKFQNVTSQDLFTILIELQLLAIIIIIIILNQLRENTENAPYLLAPPNTNGH